MVSVIIRLLLKNLDIIQLSPVVKQLLMKQKLLLD